MKSLKSLKVLVIEDSPSIRLLLEEWLLIFNCSVMSAENGRAGLELIEKQQFELVITDLAMPYVTGIEVINSVQECHPDIVTILFTCSEDQLWVGKCHPDLRITKPLSSFAQLPNLISQAQRHHQTAFAAAVA